MCGSAERGTVYGMESSEVEWSGKHSRLESSRVESSRIESSWIESSRRRRQCWVDWSGMEWSGMEWRGVAWGCAGKCAKVHFSRKPDRPDHYRCAAPGPDYPKSRADSILFYPVLIHRRLVPILTDPFGRSVRPTFERPREHSNARWTDFSEWPHLAETRSSSVTSNRLVRWSLVPLAIGSVGSIGRGY